MAWTLVEFCTALGVELVSLQRGKQRFHVALPGGEEVIITDALKVQIELALEQARARGRDEAEAAKVTRPNAGAA